MEGARTIPAARKATEAELVTDIAETMALHNFKVLSHQVTVNHEKEETLLKVTLLKGNPEQTTLKLEKGGKDDAPGDGQD